MTSAAASCGDIPRFCNGVSASIRAAVLLAPDLTWLCRMSSTCAGVKLAGGGPATVVVVELDAAPLPPFAPGVAGGAPTILVSGPGAAVVVGAGRILVMAAGGTVVGVVVGLGATVVGVVVVLPVVPMVATVV